ncbi:MAG: ABC transporter ATP-binding protein [Firmicutes bacterium]|nr:ABC transporter ATP-binding protein [Bacillota bacterium]
MLEKLLEIKDLSVVYHTDEAHVYAVNAINLEIGARETIGLVGETGAGKTTTALAILRLLPEKTGHITQGEILFKGEDLLKKSKREMRGIRGAHISMIFQDPMTSLNPTITVGDQIYESLLIHNYEGKPRDELYKRVDELLELVGIPARRRKDYPHQFSGGMKQRVVISIALACQPQLLIADEPTTALDVTIQAQVLAMMYDLKEKLQTSMIMITHDLGVVAQTCDKVAIMYAGEIIEFGLAEDIFESDQHHPYTTGLFGSIPDLDIEADRLNPIEGLMPDPTALPCGCKFHPRCKLCMEICKTTLPPQWHEGDHMISCHLYSREK